MFDVLRAVVGRRVSCLHLLFSLVACVCLLAGSAPMLFAGALPAIQLAPVLTPSAGNGTFGNNGDGGPAIDAELEQPRGVAVDGAGNVYVAENTANAYVIRKIDTSGNISTIAGNGTAGYSGDNGPATQAELQNPMGLAVDAAGNLYD